MRTEGSKVDDKVLNLEEVRLSLLTVRERETASKLHHGVYFSCTTIVRMKVDCECDKIRRTDRKRSSIRHSCRSKYDVELVFVRIQHFQTS